MCPKSSCRLKNGFYPLHFMAVILSHRRDFPCCRTNAQNSVRNLRHVPVWRGIRLMRSFFAMCRLLLGRFTALKSSLHWLSVKRTKAVEAILHRWARKALDDEMPSDLFLVALSPIAL